VRAITFVALSGICLTLVFSPAIAAGEEGLLAADGKQIYLVKPGDTLGTIAARVLGDSGRWKEIWKANPQVTNPALIYPGDTLIVGEAATETVGAVGVRDKTADSRSSKGAATAAKTAAAAILAPGELLEALREVPEPVVVLGEAFSYPAPSLPAAFYDAIGFVSAELPEASIIGVTDARSRLSPFDPVITDRGDRDAVTVGQEFRVVRPIGRVIHPLTGADLGWQMKVVGWVRLEGVSGNYSVGRVVRGVHPVMVGDRLEPWEGEGAPGDRFLSPKLSGPGLPGPVRDAALILGGDEVRVTYGEGAVVFLDRGMTSGLLPGHRLAVYRYLDPVERTGAFLVGEVQVLLSQNFTSTALVTNSLQPIEAADRLTTW
jgi:hypothetical protein